jgi:hypothetical protein
MIKTLKRLLYPEIVEKIETLDERAIRFGNAFANLARDKFDFDEVLIGIDNPETITSESYIYQSFVNEQILTPLDSDFLIKQHFLKYVNNLMSERRFVTFKLIRRYAELCERQSMYSIVDNLGTAFYFIPDENKGIFNHYIIENFIEGIGSIHETNYYMYDIETNQLSYSIDIPLSYHDNQLKIITTETSFLPPYRTYMVSVKMPIEEQRWSNKSSVSLFFGSILLKSNECEISNHEDFTKQLSKILFPFNLTDKELDNLHKPRTNLSEISKCFNTEFDDYDIIKKMTNI